MLANDDYLAVQQTRGTKTPRAIEVYVCYDAKNHIIYVGRTDRFSTRWSDHKRRKPVMVALTRRVHHMYFDTYGESLEAEAHLIRVAQPVYNTEGVTR